MHDKYPLLPSSSPLSPPPPSTEFAKACHLSTDFHFPDIDVQLSQIQERALIGIQERRDRLVTAASLSSHTSDSFISRSESPSDTTDKGEGERPLLSSLGNPPNQERKEPNSLSVCAKRWEWLGNGLRAVWGRTGTGASTELCEGYFSYTICIVFDAQPDVTLYSEVHLIVCMLFPFP